jgi:predicted Zn-dependent peptidase
MVEISTLENGLRVVTVAIPHVQSVSLGFSLRVGSRYEDNPLAGASHFIEHMVFKGTARWPTARDIAEAIEGRGGVFNASTGLESTVYWAKLAAEHLPIALDVLSDMLLHATFDPVEVDKERTVIGEEIQYTLDMPDSLSQILASRLQWPDHPLGRDVAGTRQSVAGLERAALRSFQARHYLPGETILGISGQVQHREALSLAEAYLGDWAPGPRPTFLPAPPNHNGPSLEVQSRDAQQAHLSLSFSGLAHTHPDRFALGVLNVILGDGMRSRLFQEIRERLGLAYSVDSWVSMLTDCGAIGIYAGVAGGSAVEALGAILGQLDRLRQEPVPEEELQKAKEYTKGRMVLALEDSSAVGAWYSRQIAMGQAILEPAEVMAEIDAVQPATIQHLAQTLFVSESLNLAVVGPDGSEPERFQGAMRF